MTAKNYSRGAARHNWKGGRTTDLNGYVLVLSPDHPNKNARGYVREHTLAVERAMGKLLRKTAEVHHVDENKANNANTNLVACDSHAYHFLLHKRQRALDGCGDPNAKRCVFCAGYDRQGEMVEYSKNRLNQTHAHRECMSARNRRYYKSVKAETSSEPVRPPSKERTHCPQGHTYDEANTYLYQGRRLCKECMRKRSREAQRARRQLLKSDVAK